MMRTWPTVLLSWLLGTAAGAAAERVNLIKVEGSIGPATVVTALFFIAIVGAGLRAQFLPVRAGRETMLGKVTPALARIDASGGKVFIEGEYWNAVSETVVEKGQPVEVIGFDGLTLKVKPNTP
jgi:membrane-bound serine protease (ClpP class)